MTSEDDIKGLVSLKFLRPCQGVTKKCRLSWLTIVTNSALVYEPKFKGGGGGCGVSANENSCAHGAQINFGDLGNSIFTLWLKQKKIFKHETE
jgi:hypothetical protein